MTDTLENAQAEGRAPWTNVEIDTREFVVYNDIYPVTEGHTLVVPKVNTEEAILKCFNGIGLNLNLNSSQAILRSYHLFHYIY